MHALHGARSASFPVPEIRRYRGIDKWVAQAISMTKHVLPSGERNSVQKTKHFVLLVVCCYSCVSVFEMCRV